MTAIRELPDWIDTFLEYTDQVPSPEHFRRWAAYSAIAGVVERRVWSILRGKFCYPNLYVLLVARPGIGKTVAIDEVIDLWTHCGKIRLAPSGMTKAALIDHINEKHSNLMINGTPQMYHPLCIAAGEFGVLLPDHNIDFLNVLNDMWDCRTLFEDRTRKDGHKIVERPYINMIAGTQPAYLKLILPDVAFNMGFTARIIMVHAAFGVEQDMFAPFIAKEYLKDKLVADLKIMQNQIGVLEPSAEAREFISGWYWQREEDAPEHSLLTSYNVRRPQQIQKLAMISSISRDGEGVIEKQDYERALKMLLEAEKDMPQIFKEMASSEDTKELEEIMRWCFEYVEETGQQTVHETDLNNYINGRVPVHRIDFFLKALISSGKLEVVGVALPGQRQFRPIKIVSKYKAK